MKALPEKSQTKTIKKVGPSGLCIPWGSKTNPKYTYLKTEQVLLGDVFQSKNEQFLQFCTVFTVFSKDFDLLCALPSTPTLFKNGPLIKKSHVGNP